MLPSHNLQRKKGSSATPIEKKMATFRIEALGYYRIAEGCHFPVDVFFSSACTILESSGLNVRQFQLALLQLCRAHGRFPPTAFELKFAAFNVIEKVLNPNHIQNKVCLTQFYRVGIYYLLYCIERPNCRIYQLKRHKAKCHSL